MKKVLAVVAVLALGFLAIGCGEPSKAPAKTPAATGATSSTPAGTK